MNKHIFKLTIISLFFVAFAPIASATDDPIKKSPLDLATEREVTIIRDAHGDGYHNPTLKNLSRLYWRLNVFDPQDDVAIDNYLRINECDIFTAYSKDEFEWVQIRNAARRNLLSPETLISNKFKFVMPIYLGNYLPDQGGFEIIKNSGFPNLKRIEFVSPYTSKKICNTLVHIPDYEKNILLILEEPLDYTFVEMDDHVAQAFILRKQYESEKIDEKLRLRRYQRQAFIRLRMTLHEYQGNIKGRTLDGNLAIIYGTLDGIDIFDDRDQKLLLASYSVDELREKALAKHEAHNITE
ncbi:MAG: DUF4852 domain-containing protein [Pseudomonadota bacterium]